MAFCSFSFDMQPLGSVLTWNCLLPSNRNTVIFMLDVVGGPYFIKIIIILKQFILTKLSYNLVKVQFLPKRGVTLIRYCNPT